MKSEYAVVLYFDNHTNAIFQSMIDKIAEATGNHYMTNNQIPPHITIADFFTEDEPDISKLAEKIESGKIVFKDLGCFEPTVLYASSELNDYLRKCNTTLSDLINKLGYEENKLYTYNNWIPHLTLATKLDSGELEQAFSAVDFIPCSGRSERIALVKCNPYREICCCNL